MEQEQINLNKIYELRDKFIVAVKGREYFPSQKALSNKILKSVFLNEGEVIVGEFTRQHGKTTLISETVGFLDLFYFPICIQYGIEHYNEYNVGFFAPQQQQAQTGFNLLKDFLMLCKNKGFDFNIDAFNGDTINIWDKFPRRQIYCFTASPTSHPESKTLHLIIYDESQDMVDRQIDKAIAPMGSSTNATQIFIGVAGYQRCKFWNLIETLPNENKFIVPVDEAIKERDEMYAKTKNLMYKNYKKFLEKQLRLQGITEDSDHYKTQYLLQWILERGQFITYDNLQALEKDYTIYEEYSDEMFGGIDWGKAHDSTVLTVIDGGLNIINWHEWIGDDYNTQIEEIANIIKTKYHGLKNLNCDSTGNQDMGVDSLRAKLNQYNVNTRVNGVNFSTHKDGMYKNLHRLMHNITMNGKIVEEAKIGFPLNYNVKIKEKFIRQFLDLQKEIKNEKWHCHHPEGPQYHDDYTDSLALACYNFRPNIMPAGRRFLIG